MLDLSTLDTSAGAERGFELQLQHPVTHAPLPMWITLRGQDGPTWRDRQRDLQRARLDAAQRTDRMVTQDDIEDDTISLLAGVTVGWRGEFTLDGAELPFSEAAAAALYRRFLWIREQVAAAGAKRANFLHGSASD